MTLAWFHNYTRRQKLALCAAAYGVTVAGLRHHVHLVLNDPSSWTMALHHKCGWAAFLGLGWMAWELARMTAGAWLETLLLPSEA
jgi:hypothetical protein